MAKQTKTTKSAGSKKGAAVAKRPPAKAAEPAPKPRKAAAPKTTPEEDSSMLEVFALDAIRDIYYAEKQILKVLPKMIKASTTQELKDSFGRHIDVTKEQIVRLEQAFEVLGKRAQGKKCEAIEGIIREAEGIIEDTQKGTMTRDVALIVACQKVEHYEIASYGGIVQIAKTLGQNEVADLLGITLGEEKEADQILTDIAENNINMQAAEEEGGEEVED